MLTQSSSPNGNTSDDSQSTNSSDTHINLHRRRIVQNFLLIWLDASTTPSNPDSKRTIKQLRRVVNDINVFTNPDECMQFLRNVQKEKAFIVISDSLGQTLVPRIHSMEQVDAIYIFCSNRTRHEEWEKAWPKIKGRNTTIQPICKALRLAVQQYNQDSIAVSFARPEEEGVPNTGFNQLESSFMYTQLFKNALLDMKHDKRAVRDLLRYCQDKYAKNKFALEFIDEFDRSYRSEKAIWWYRREGFTYDMLNRALRLLEADIIVNMGFFINDLHRQIQHLHKQQISKYQEKPFVVYRGQGLSLNDFEKLRKTKGGLMSFNAFLSTSRDKKLSLRFAQDALAHTDKVGLLFIMTIDPNIRSTPFADIPRDKEFKRPAEILFSTHPVFRIADVENVDGNARMFEVQLTMTTVPRAHWHTLIEHLGKDARSSTGWHRIGKLLMQMGERGRAEELYRSLLEQTFNQADAGLINHQLGRIKSLQSDSKEAVHFYEKALYIYQKTLHANHPDVATTYNNIGAVHYHMREYEKALSFYEKSLVIYGNTLSADHPLLANPYNNIGAVHYHMGDYSKALEFYNKALNIRQKNLPADHPSIAASYNNIGLVYFNTGNDLKALRSFQKALDIREKTLPVDDAEVATSNNNMGMVYKNMGDNSKALSYYREAMESYGKVLDSQEKNLPANHPDVATSNDNIGLVYFNTKDYLQALRFFEKALNIRQKSRVPNHPDVANSYNNLGLVYFNTGEYKKALSFYEQALNIRENTLPVNRSDVATSYDNIGAVHNNMGDYSNALASYEKALDIQQKSRLPNHPNVATSYNNIGLAYFNMGKYSMALSFFEKALNIREKNLLPNHPDVITSYKNIGAAHYNLGEYWNALSFYEKALNIQEKNLPVNHSDVITSYNNVGTVYNNMGVYSKALSSYGRALTIEQKKLPANDRDVAIMSSDGPDRADENEPMGYLISDLLSSF